MREKLSAAHWLGVVICFAGFASVLVTKSVRVLLWFGLAVNLLICFDRSMWKRSPTLSLSGARDEMETRFRPSPLVWAGFALTLAGWICFSHIRTAAVLMMTGFSLMLLDRFTKTRSIPAR